MAACGSGSSGTSGSAPAATGAPAAPAGGPLDLKGAGCPDTVVMQQDWQPEAEHGAMYSVVGPNYTIDTNAKSVTGPLVAQGVDTGVKVEVRSGGPNTGFKPTPALMYVDDKITARGGEHRPGHRLGRAEPADGRGRLPADGQSRRSSCGTRRPTPA